MKNFNPYLIVLLAMRDAPQIEQLPPLTNERGNKDGKNTCNY